MSQSKVTKNSNNNSNHKAKKKNTKYFVVKIPKFLADEWWDNNKYPVGSGTNQHTLLGRMYDMNDKKNKSSNNNNDKLASLNVVVNPTNYMRHQKELYESIPLEFRLKQRPPKRRRNTKHGEVVDAGADSLLIFNDKPEFGENDDVEVLNPNIKSNNILDKYCRGHILKVNNDRTYNIRLNSDHNSVLLTNIHKRYIRLKKYNEKQDICKKKSKTQFEFDLQPIPNREYFEFIKKRKNKQTKKIVKVVPAGKMDETKKSLEKVKKTIYSTTIQKNSDGYTYQDRKTKSKSSSIDTKPKKRKEKAVRKEKEYYKNVLFNVFDKYRRTKMTQNEITKYSNEKWAFIKDVVVLYCNQKGKENNSRVWELKDEFKIAGDYDNDAKIDSFEPPKKKRRLND